MILAVPSVRAQPMRRNVRSLQSRPVFTAEFQMWAQAVVIQRKLVGSFVRIR